MGKIHKVPWAQPFFTSDEFYNLKESFEALAKGSPDHVRQFEELLSKRLRADVVTVNNGTSAIIASLMAAGVSPGDYVIAPTYTFASVVGCVRVLGAKPILVDSDPKTFNIDIEATERALRTRRVKALIHVDVGGVPGNIDRLLELSEDYGCTLIEDAAEGLGTEYKGRMIGSYPHLTTFSFHPAKQITTVEGGAISTKEESLAKKIRLIINHGMADSYEHVTLGLNFRLTDLQAAIGIAQLAKLDLFIKNREKIAARYTEALSDSATLQLIPKYVTRLSRGMFLFLARTSKLRAIIMNQMSSAGIEVRRPWKPVHLQPYFRSIVSGRFPVAESIYNMIVSPPLTNKMAGQHVRKVVETLQSAFKTENARC